MRSISLWVLPGKTTWSSFNFPPNVFLQQSKGWRRWCTFRIRIGKYQLVMSGPFPFWAQDWSHNYRTFWGEHWCCLCSTTKEKLIKLMNLGTYFAWSWAFICCWSLNLEFFELNNDDTHVVTTLLLPSAWGQAVVKKLLTQGWDWFGLLSQTSNF